MTGFLISIKQKKDLTNYYMSDKNDYSETPFSLSEVQGFICLLDSIINRMANNSANAKNWLMTLLAAAIAIQWTQNQINQVLWLLLPTIMFMLTDMYYLGMERHFKEIQKTFINSVRAGNDIKELVYNIPKTTKLDQLRNTFSTIDSLSIWPFYTIVTGVIITVYILF